jgi:hypothetical protein
MHPAAKKFSRCRFRALRAACAQVDATSSGALVGNAGASRQKRGVTTEADCLVADQRYVAGARVNVKRQIAHGSAIRDI